MAAAAGSNVTRRRRRGAATTLEPSSSAGRDEQPRDSDDTSMPRSADSADRGVLRRRRNRRCPVEDGFATLSSTSSPRSPTRGSSRILGNRATTFNRINSRCTPKADGNATGCRRSPFTATERRKINANHTRAEVARKTGRPDTGAENPEVNLCALGFVFCIIIVVTIARVLLFSKPINTSRLALIKSGTSWIQVGGLRVSVSFSTLFILLKDYTTSLFPGTFVQDLVRARTDVVCKNGATYELF